MITNVEDYVSVQSLLALVLGFGITAALMPAVIRIAMRFRILDFPDGHRRLHSGPIPRLGGVAVFVGLALAMGIMYVWLSREGSSLVPADQRDLLPGLVLGAAIVFGVGIVDDLRGITPRVKLWFQIGAAACVVGFGFRVQTIAMSVHTPSVSLGVLGVPITMLWIVGVTNAFNLIDGVDGLAGTFVVLGLLAAIGVGAYLHEASTVLLPIVALGSVLAFLRVNWSPARVFLGDAGSMTLGFVLSVWTVTSATNVSGTTFISIPLLVLGFPVLDTLIAIARRWLRGVSFSQADGRHIHHRLLARGFSTRGTVALLAALFLVIAISGIFVAFASPRVAVALAVGTVLFVACASWFGVQWLGYDEFLYLGGAIMSAVKNPRGAVRAELVATDVSARIRAARTLADIRAALGDLVEESSMLDVELILGVDRDHRPSKQQISPLGAQPVRFEYPFAWQSSTGARTMIFRIWSRRSRGTQSQTMERVAARVGPALEEWFRSSAYREWDSAAVVVPSRDRSAAGIEAAGPPPALLDAARRQLPSA